MIGVPALPSPISGAVASCWRNSSSVARDRRFGACAGAFATTATGCPRTRPGRPSPAGAALPRPAPFGSSAAPVARRQPRPRATGSGAAGGGGSGPRPTLVGTHHAVVPVAASAGAGGEVVGGAEAHHAVASAGLHDRDLCSDMDALGTEIGR